MSSKNSVEKWVRRFRKRESRNSLLAVFLIWYTSPALFEVVSYRGAVRRDLSDALPGIFVSKRGTNSVTTDASAVVPERLCLACCSTAEWVFHVTVGRMGGCVTKQESS